MRSTTKSVKAQLHEHILENFTPDFGWDKDEPVQNLKEQIDYMRIPGESDYQTGLNLVDGGTFLVYYGDIRNFIDSLGIESASNKGYDDQRVWEYYRHLLAREIAALIN